MKLKILSSFWYDFFLTHSKETIDYFLKNTYLTKFLFSNVFTLAFQKKGSSFSLHFSQLLQINLSYYCYYY